MRMICAVSDLKRSCRWGSVRPCSQRERFPADWKDPLELYGRFRAELTTPVFDSATERNHVNELIRLHGAGWVWSNRHRLVSLRKFLSRAATGTFTRGPERSPAPEVAHGSTL
jgi:hypothetical protein